MTEPVRAAIVGAGGFASKGGAPMLHASKAVRYVAVCDPDRAAAERAAEAFGARTVVPSLNDILDRDDIEMVDLHTPNFLHADQAVAALRAGKHVLCQKPLAPSVTEAKRMIQAGRDTGRLLGVFMDDLNDPITHDMKRAVQAGFVGRPTAFAFSFGRPGWRDMPPDSWRRSLAKTGGGSFILLAIHNVRIISWVLESRVRRVTGFQKTLLAPMEGDDSTAAAIELENGLVGTAASSYILESSSGAPTQFTAVWGTDGALWKQRQGGCIRAYSPTRTFQGEILNYLAPGETGAFTRPDDRFRTPTVHDEFAAAIRTGRPFETPGEAGLHDVAVCQAITESSRTARAVDIEEFIAER